ncbi:MAG: NADPH-dependent FMN reductase [Hyphomicrobiales bacterium]
MKILAFAASSSSTSINKALVTHAAAVLKDELHTAAEIEIIDLNDFEMPIYSADREKTSGIPELAQNFLDKISAADAVLISYAEHNGHYTAAFKNVFDWASRIDSKVYQDKPMIIFSTSPGPGGGASVMNAAKTSAPFFGADIKASLSVPKFHENFDLARGELTDAELQTQLRAALSTLI